MSSGRLWKTLHERSFDQGPSAASPNQEVGDMISGDCARHRNTLADRGQKSGTECSSSQLSSLEFTTPRPTATIPSLGLFGKPGLKCLVESHPSFVHLVKLSRSVFWKTFVKTLAELLHIRCLRCDANSSGSHEREWKSFDPSTNPTCVSRYAKRNSSCQEAPCPPSTADGLSHCPATRGQSPTKASSSSIPGLTSPQWSSSCVLLMAKPRVPWSNALAKQHSNSLRTLLRYASTTCVATSCLRTSKPYWRPVTLKSFLAYALLSQRSSLVGWADQVRDLFKTVAEKMSIQIIPGRSAGRWYCAGERLRSNCPDVLRGRSS